MGRLSVPTKEKLTAPFRSKRAFIEFVKSPEGNEGHASIGDARWSNKDLEPTPVEHRTWTW
jgi:NCS1 family nucleobase:cation symporter-1